MTMKFKEIPFILSTEVTFSSAEFWAVLQSAIADLECEICII